MSKEKGDFVELYKSSKGVEKPLILICLACSCIVPFTLLTLQFGLSAILWFISLITVYLFKVFRQRRTKEKIDLDIVPKINNM